MIQSLTLLESLVSDESKQKRASKARFYCVTGGSCEIRTHGGLTPSPVFKTGAFNRSAKLPS